MHSALKGCAEEIRNCRKCFGICGAIGPYGTNTALNYVEPLVPIEVLFVAESPPHKPANFFYHPEASNTRFRNRLLTLINLADLKPAKTVSEFTARGYFLADAINCGWNKDKKVVKQPTQTERNNILTNCLGYLHTQLIYLEPKAVVMMGQLATQAGNNQTITDAVKELNIGNERIIKMPFITTTPVTTELLVQKLSVLAGMGRDI